MPDVPRTEPRSPWPRRMALTLSAFTFLLLLAGGMVTTYRVGMAVPDWPTTFGHNMFTYPLDEMLASFGVTVEHSHRLLGALVGVIAIATVIACFARGRRALRVMSLVVLAAVIGQGVLGGTRVLANDPRLAFLHGSLAQVVFASMAVLLVLSSQRWSAAERHPCKEARGLQRLALFTVLLVFGQIVLGAWLRHSGFHSALGAHILLALAVLGAVIALARRLRVTFDEGARGGHDRGPLLAIRKWLVVLLGLQLVLGVVATASIFAWSGGFAGQVSVGEAVSATLHVGVGALLLASTVAAALWSFRLVSVGPASAPVGAPRLEGA